MTGSSVSKKTPPRKAAFSVSFVTSCSARLWEPDHYAELLSRGLGYLGKRHGSDPARWALEHWIAKARHNFVENLHSETARSPAVPNAGRHDPNVKVRLDPTVAGNRHFPRALRRLTDVIRDSYPC